MTALENQSDLSLGRLIEPKAFAREKKSRLILVGLNLSPYFLAVDVVKASAVAASISFKILFA